MEVKKVLSGYRRGVLSCVQEAEQIAQADPAHGQRLRPCSPWLNTTPHFGIQRIRQYTGKERDAGKESKTCVWVILSRTYPVQNLHLMVKNHTTRRNPACCNLQYNWERNGRREEESKTCFFLGDIEQNVCPLPVSAIGGAREGA